MEYTLQHHEAISQETYSEFLKAMQSMMLAKRRVSKVAVFHFDEGYIGFDKFGMFLDGTGMAQNAMGSGQIYDKTTDSEIEVWMFGEQLDQKLDFNGEQVIPTGVVCVITAIPEDPVESLFRDVLPLLDGRVIEIKGHYLSLDPVQMRTLNDTEVRTIIEMMEPIESRIAASRL